MALVRASIVFTYYTKLFRMGADRHNSFLMSLLLLVAETIIENHVIMIRSSVFTNTFKNVPAHRSSFQKFEVIELPLLLLLLLLLLSLLLLLLLLLLLAFIFFIRNRSPKSYLQVR